MQERYCAPWWRFPALVLAATPLLVVFFLLMSRVTGADNLLLYPLLFFSSSLLGFYFVLPFTGALLALGSLPTSWQLWNLFTFRFCLMLALMPAAAAVREAYDALRFFDPPPEVPVGPGAYLLFAPLLFLSVFSLAWWIAPRWPWLSSLYPLVATLAHEKVFFPLNDYWGVPDGEDEFGMPTDGLDHAVFLDQFWGDSFLFFGFLFAFALTAVQCRKLHPR